MYNIKSVSKLLDMPAVTIRAWERRYQVVAPVRSESGHRLYTEQDIEDLRWLKVQTEEKSVNISQAVKMLEKMREERRPSSAADVQMPLATQNVEALRNDLYRALLSLDAAKAHAVLDLGFSMFHFDVMFHHVMAPLLVRIGEEWERGEVSVAQEHYASTLMSQRFSPFLRVFPVDPALPSVLSFCPEGEPHGIGLLLFVLFLRRHGLDVIHLGPNTPPDGLDAVIRQKGVQIAAVSLTDAGQREAAEAMLGALRTEFPELKFVVGGQGFAGATGEWAAHVLGGDLASWEKWLMTEVPSCRKSANTGIFG